MPRKTCCISSQTNRPNGTRSCIDSDGAFIFAPLKGPRQRQRQLERFYIARWRIHGRRRTSAKFYIPLLLGFSVDKHGHLHVGSRQSDLPLRSNDAHATLFFPNSVLSRPPLRTVLLVLASWLQDLVIRIEALRRTFILY